MLSILIPILHGLQRVHKIGYLHQDIKPGNIYLRKDGRPVLLDFGATRQSMDNHTQGVTSMVTPCYAIEQYNTSGQGTVDRFLWYGCNPVSLCDW